MAGVSLGGAWLIDTGKDRTKDWIQHFVASGILRSKNTSQRLEINAAQQAAWEEFKSARKAFARQSTDEPLADSGPGATDGGQVQRAAEAARARSALSGAEQRLRDVLSPEQRRTLDQAAPPVHDKSAHVWRMLAMSFLYLCNPT
jgi:hypothetical protein